MPDARKEPEVLIPEVLPPERGPFNAPPPRPPPRKSRARRFFGPILVGALIDVIAFLPPGRIKFVIGGVAAFWALGQIDVRFSMRLFLSLAAACYCGLTMQPRRIPLATIVGTLSVFFRQDR